MSELVFATVISEFKTSWAESISDPEMIELLYDAVALPTNLVNQNGDPRPERPYRSCRNRRCWHL